MSQHQPDTDGPTGGLIYRRLVSALIFSLHGLKRAMQEEACKVQLVLLLILFPAGLWLGDGPIEKLFLTVPLLVVFMIELLNTAVEVTINRISTDRHQLSKEAKDLGSAAVFVAMMIVVLCWGLLLWPKL